MTDCLRGLGIIDPQWFTSGGLIRGREVHRATHYLDQCRLDWSSIKAVEEWIEQPVEPYVRGYEAFKAETGFKVLRSEMPGFHPDRLYCGCRDKEGVLPDGTPWLGEVKTYTVPDWTALQTGAYLPLLPNSPNGREWRRVGIELTKDGGWGPTFFDDPTDTHTFYAMWASYQWGLKHGRYKDADR